MNPASLLQGGLVWVAALGLVALLPGVPWRCARPGGFPFHALPPTLLAFACLAAAALGLACLAGPAACGRRGLALWESPPDLLWGALVLALWPAHWGPPGQAGWMAALLLSALPSELRWLTQALPPEAPFPAAWGPGAVRRARLLALARLAPRWMLVRVPLWITATVVLERILAVPGLGTDWMNRVAQRDRAGLAAWILGFAVLWALTQRGRRSPA